jgi:maltose/moltooligosaccharide transporter
LFGGFPMAIIVIAGVSMLIAGLAVFFVRESKSTIK